MDLENLASVNPHASLLASVIPKIWCRGLHMSVRTGGKHPENMGMFMIVTDARPRGARYAWWFKWMVLGVCTEDAV